MSDMTFHTSPGAVVDRCLLVLCLNTGGADAPVWSPVGKRVEDSSMELDWGEASRTDIFGETYTTMKKPVITQTFEPCELDAGDTAQLKIWNLAIRRQDAAALCNQDMLVVHLYAGREGAAFAERYRACAVKPSGLGGSANVGMPLDVTFGGKRTVGTAVSEDGVITFTPEGGGEA